MLNKSPDRAVAPLLNAFKAFDIQAPVAYRLSDVPVFVLEAGDQEVLRIDLEFAAGSWHESRQLAASLTNRMLQEGSTHRTGKALADFFDFYGAYLQYESSADRSAVSLYCLSRQAAVLLPVLFELVFEPAFPEEELHTTIRNLRQQLLVEQEKVAFLARRGFNNALFGPEHPYGRSGSDAAYAAIERAHLAAFHHDFYVKDRLSIGICGKDTAVTLPLLEKLLLTIPAARLPWEARPFTALSQTGRVHIPKADAIQHGLRLGKRIVGKTHPDYHGLKVLNTVLGGYFGSRLMSNIREDKGYTYGIGSAIVSYEHDAVFTIATEVGKEVSEAALKEIHTEIERLRTTRIPAEELDTVRQYLQGVYMGSFDGAFALADRFRDIQHFGLDYSYYQKYLQTVQQIQPEKLQELAVTYLNPKSLVTIVAGG